MSVQREPFFSEADQKLLLLFRPRRWSEWWRAEPFISKAYAVVTIALGVIGLAAILVGKPDIGKGIAFLSGILAATALGIIGLGTVIVLIRAALRRGYHTAIPIPETRKQLQVRASNTFKAIFWIGFAVLIVAAFWDYLSLSPTKSWYAFRNRVPVERAEMLAEPHDCEFSTAPLGSKHCHYNARADVIAAENFPDGKKRLVIDYVRVED